MSEHFFKMGGRRQAVLGNMMAVYERNYQQLIVLLPDLSFDRLQLSSDQDRMGQVQITVLQRHRYTTDIELTHALLTASPHLPALQIELRLYHDACLVEVMACQNQSHFQVEYAYQNQQMHQRFERQQLNYFFAEWLSYCLKKDYAATDVILAS